MRYRGFTLIEAMFCLLIAATLATLATVNLRGGRKSAGLEAAIIELQSHDRLMRDRARRHGRPGTLVFSLDTGQAWREETDTGELRVVPLQSIGGATRVKQVRPAADLDEQTLKIQCVAGRTPSYAVLLAGADKEQWLVVAGLTGQFEKVDDEATVADIFHQLTGGDDAR